MERIQVKPSIESVFLGDPLMTDLLDPETTLLLHQKGLLKEIFRTSDIVFTPSELTQGLQIGRAGVKVGDKTDVEDERWKYLYGKMANSQISRYHLAFLTQKDKVCLVNMGKSVTTIAKNEHSVLLQPLPNVAAGTPFSQLRQHPQFERYLYPLEGGEIVAIDTRFLGEDVRVLTLEVAVAHPEVGLGLHFIKANSPENATQKAD
ncbi:MAG TPA: hypothetical protein VD999_01680 [Vitreimonas sp.]|nr:hypothetical protein [Vitreimonas sp.]